MGVPSIADIIAPAMYCVTPGCNITLAFVDVAGVFVLVVVVVVLERLGGGLRTITATPLFSHLRL